jgi:hypothetical protein
LLALANPTTPVVHGLAGVALSRTWIGVNRPGALVLPIDGHEDMFVFPKLGHGRILADLLAIYEDQGRLVLEVVESKWSTKANLTAQVRHGALQASNSAEVLRAAYFVYDGVDREVRLDNLREVIGFHAARAARHGVPSADDVVAFLGRLTTPAFNAADIRATVLAWCPDGAFGADSTETINSSTVHYFDSSVISKYDEAMKLWPSLPGPAEIPSGESASEAIRSIVAETLTEGQIGEESPGARVSPEQEFVSPATDESVAGADEPTATANLITVSATDDADADESGEVDLGSLAGVEAVEEAGRADASAAALVSEDPVHRPCVRLGSLIPSRKAATWCPSSLSNGHLVLIGGSGAGKTTALRHLSGELSPNVPVLVLDFHGDIEIPGMESSVVTFDYAGNTAFINPFFLDASLGPKLPPSRLKWEFLEAWRSVYPTMGIHQVNYLASLIEEAFASKGVTENPATWAREVDFGDVIDRFDESTTSEAVKAKIASYMKQFREWQIFHGGAPINVESFLLSTTRLDLSQLYETARDILADVVLRRLFLLARAMGPYPAGAADWDKFRVYVVVDEAQVLMRSSSDAKASLARYAAEARKFGIGLVLATQLRDNVPTEIWGNIDTRLFMQALDPVERSKNAKAANVPEAMIRSLARGQAILTSSSQPDAPAAVLQIEPSWMKPTEAS